MSNLIHLENTASLRYNLDIIPGTDLVAITQRNVAIVEAMIRNDSAYIRSNQVTASIQYKRGKGHSTKLTWKERVAEDAPNIKYGGSTAFWMSKLKNYLLFNTSDPLYAYEDVVYYTISAIDRENSILYVGKTKSFLTRMHQHFAVADTYNTTGALKLGSKQRKFLVGNLKIYAFPIKSDFVAYYDVIAAAVESKLHTILKPLVGNPRV